MMWAQGAHHGDPQEAGAATAGQRVGGGALGFQGLAHERAHDGDAREELAQAAALSRVRVTADGWPVLQGGVGKVRGIWRGVR